VLTALIDGQMLTPGRLATVTELPPADLDDALLDLELAGLIRRTAGGVRAINLPSTRLLPADPADSGAGGMGSWTAGASRTQLTRRGA
jgi:hypothetical protein